MNNQFQKASITTYEDEFAEIINMAFRFAGGHHDRVFVLSIPDYGYTPFGQSNQESISTEIDLFNAVNKSISDSLGVSWFDITPISRKGLALPELVASDGLHPSGQMYTEWLNLIYPEIKSKLD